MYSVVCFAKSVFELEIKSFRERSLECNHGSLIMEHIKARVSGRRLS